MVTVAVYLNAPKPSYEYLRIHVRANSNSEKDQSVKMEIKDLLVDYLTPYIAKCDNKSEPIVTLNAQKPNLERLIDAYLLKNGFNCPKACGYAIYEDALNDIDDFHFPVDSVNYFYPDW